MEWASDFLREYAVPERDPGAFARAVQRYAQEHIRFFRERPERFASPLRTIQWGFGDCDDKSSFIATVLRSFRIPVRLVFVRYRKRNPDGTTKRISHVYPQAEVDGKWLALESVHPWPMGKDPVIEARRKGYSPTVEIIGP
jgi:transglutaminase-like putative cysteine protease